MNYKQYKKIENYMLECMNDSAHDEVHIYRVLYIALDIAITEKNVNLDVLIASCLLHDIGRDEQFKDPNICHAKFGSEKAFDFLIRNGWTLEKAFHAKECIQTHRFRNNNPPKSIEAKILFDSDKIDATGTLGIARTLFYNGQVSQSLYCLDKDSNVLDGSSSKNPSFFKEYKYKLEKLYDKFHTKKGRQIAKKRQPSAVSFYESMLEEVKSCYKTGKIHLQSILDKSS